MGRKTFESLPGMLPKRHHVVISRSCSDLGEGVEMCSSVEEFLKRYKDVDEEIYCIGGGMIYSEMLAYADKLVMRKRMLRFIFLNLTSLCIQKQYFPT